MTWIDLNRLREVANEANRGLYTTEAAAMSFDESFDPPTVLALLNELKDARITLDYDQIYIREVDARMRPYLAQAWDEGFTLGYQRDARDSAARGNPYREGV